MKIEIRSSMLPSYPDCPRRGAAKQFRELIINAGFTLRNLMPSIGAAIGTGCHSGAINLLNDVILSGVPGSKSDAEELSIIRFREQIELGVVWDSITCKNNDAEKQIRILLNSFLLEALPQIKPKFTEFARLAVLGEIENTGHTDIETIENGIDDLKFGAQFRPYHSQLGDYAILRESMAGGKVESLRLFHMPRVSLKKNYPGMSVFHYDIRESKNAAWYTIRMIRGQVLKFIETKNPWSFPANPMSMMCSEKYCPAHGTDFCKMACVK